METRRECGGVVSESLGLGDEDCIAYEVGDH